jgi:ribosomal protein S2
MNKYEQNLIFWQLLLYGVHVGHRFRNSSLYAGWLVFTYTYKTLIINLYKTILGFKNGNLGYDYCTKVGSPIWFLNLNKAYDIYTNEAALRCGEYAYSTYWIHGMISNWLFLADQMNQLCHYTKDAHKGQFKKLEMDYSPWFLSRWSWPRSVLITSVHTSEWPSHECLVSKTASVGIVDTNIPGHISNIATPGNDDSLDSIVYYNTNSSQYILDKKYGRITGWLHLVRTSRRNIAFSEWVLRYYLNIKKLGIHLHKDKLLINIRNREKSNKMSDNMMSLIKFNIDILNYWGLGIKFYFSLGSGESKFQGSLDLYSQDGFEIINQFKIYGLMEKFKKRGFFICKILNYYLLKRIWNKTSTYVVKKKFMSNKWFKFRFLTTAYYKKVWFDDYYKTNFLFNRFWRNRIFKTFFRRRNFRKSKFSVKFFKFINVYRYNIKRGFLDNFSSSYIKISSFSSVAFSYGFGYFKKFFYTKLINKGNRFNNLNNRKKKSDLKKWLTFKKVIMIDLAKIINLNTLYNKFMRFTNFYKVYSILRNKLKSFIYIIYCYVNFYFMFRFHNKKDYRFIKRTKNKKIVKLFRALKNLCKFPKYVEFYYRSQAPFKRIELWFLKKYRNFKLYDFFNFSISRIFSMLSLNYRKNNYNFLLKYRYKRVKNFKKYFKKRKKLNKIANHRNWVIDTLDFKYNKFKNTKEVRKIVKNLHKRMRINYITEYFSNKYNININNRSSFKQVYNIAKKKNKLALRLLKFNNLKYNIKNFNFNQISRKFYNKKINHNWLKIVDTLKNRDLWNIDDSNDTETPSYFIKIYSKTKVPTDNMMSKHNLYYFNKPIVNVTYKGILKEIDLVKNSLNYLKNKRLYIYINNYLLLKRLLFKKSNKIKLLKYKFKTYIKKLGKRYIFNVIGNKLFNKFKFIKLWYLMKKKFNVNKGFLFKLWELNFNRTITKLDLFNFNYYYKNNLKNYTYFYIVRFINIYSYLLSLLKNNILCEINRTILKKNKYFTYKNKLRKIYWF